MQAVARERRDQLQTILDAAQRLADGGRYLDALGQLENATGADHSLLRPLLQEAARRVKEYPRQRDEAVKHASAAIDEARALRERRQYEAAYQRLASTPKAFVTAEMRAVEGELKALVDETKSLRRDVGSALKQRRYDGLLPQVERLAELSGHDPKVEQLRDQLRTRQANHDKSIAEKLVLAARDALKKLDYAAAGAAIDRIPHDPLQGEILRIVAEIRERVWLYQQLKTAPYIDATLVKAAQRLRKLQPTDQRVEQLLQRVTRQWEQQRRSRPNEPTTWAQPAASSVLEVPIALCPVPPALSAAHIDQQATALEMLAAYGLAVQAAGKAKYPVNLAPGGNRSSWLGRIPKLRSGKGALLCWGVDVGTSGLKAVQLTVEGQRADVTQTAVIRGDHDRVDQPGAERRRYREAVAEFLSQFDVSGCPVAINLSGAQTLGRFFELPAPKPDKFADAVKFEVKARIPIAPDDVVHDFLWTPVQEEDDGAGATAMRRVALAAANREHVELRLQPWADAGVSQLVVQSGCIALANALHRDADDAHPSPLAENSWLVGVGAETATIVTLTTKGLWFRGAYLGMRQFDAALAAAAQITQAEAEQLRRSPHRAALMHEVDLHLQGEYHKFTEGLRRMIDQFQHETGAPPSRLLLCGGGSQQFGLLRYLRLGH